MDRIFAEEIARLTRRLAGIDGAQKGSVGCPQRFGGSLNVHPLLHTIAVDGVFEKTDAGGIRFHEAPPSSKDDVAEVAQRVRDRAVRWLRCHHYLDQCAAEERSNEAAEPSAIDGCTQLALAGGAFLARLLVASHLKMHGYIANRPGDFSERSARTVMLVAAGVAGDRHHAAFHRLFSAAHWSLDQLGLIVFRLILPWLEPGTITLTLDDTLACKRGVKMFGAGMHLDALLLAFLLSWTFREPLLGFLLPAAVVLELLLLGTAVLALAIRSASPHPNAQLLPAQMILRETGLRIFPRDGEPFEARWHYIKEAIEKRASYELLLLRDPPLVYVVYKSRLEPGQYQLLGRWLRDNGLLKRETAMPD